MILSTQESEAGGSEVKDHTGHTVWVVSSTVRQGTWESLGQKGVARGERWLTAGDPQLTPADGTGSRHSWKRASKGSDHGSSSTGTQGGDPQDENREEADCKERGWG